MMCTQHGQSRCAPSRALGVIAFKAPLPRGVSWGALAGRGLLPDWGALAGRGFLLDCIPQVPPRPQPCSSVTPSANILCCAQDSGISSGQMCHHGDRSASSFLGPPLRPAPPRVPSPHGSEVGSWTLRQGLPSSLRGVRARKEGRVERSALSCCWLDPA